MKRRLWSVRGRTERLKAGSGVDSAIHGVDYDGAYNTADTQYSYHLGAAGYLTDPTRIRFRPKT